MRRHSSIFPLSAIANRFALHTLTALAIAGALAPAASADRQTAQEIASQAGSVSPAAARAAVSAAERVEREMRKEGALRSDVLGCWRADNAVNCTGEVEGNDGWVEWRCVVQIRIRRSGRRQAAKVTDAVCVAAEAAQGRKKRDRDGR